MFLYTIVFYWIERHIRLWFELSLYVDKLNTQANGNESHLRIGNFEAISKEQSIKGGLFL